MKIDQAIYGEVRGGHALRMATSRSQLSVDLASRLDLPDTAPPGAQWSPVLSGFPCGEMYVLARTFSDPAATRAGMVLSHALIAPLVEMVDTADLRPLLALLITAPEVPERLEVRDVPASAERPEIATDLVATAEALVKRGNGPVVRVGCEKFDDLVVSLWFHLWPELRTRLAFRLSFGPQDLVDVPVPALVCTPSAVAARWTGYRVVESTAAKNSSRACAIISGGVGREPLLQFAHELGARLDSFGDLSLLARAYDLASSSSSIFEECVSVIRLVERLSPNAAAGVAAKAMLIDRLTGCLPGATVPEILLLRNLGAETIPAMGAVWAGVRTWAAKNRFSPAEDESVLSAIDDATSTEGAVAAWRESLLDGIADASQDQSSTFPAAFWRWAEARPTTLAALTHHLPVDRNVESRLVGTSPRTLRRPAGEAVMALAESKCWFRLHGAAAGASLPIREAIHRQISVDSDPANVDGVRAVLRGATAMEALTIGLDVEDARVRQVAAEEVARTPEVLKDIDFRSSAAQEIWARALTINANAWRGPADPAAAFNILLENVIDDRSVNSALVTILSASPLADLNDYPRRSDVWSRVSGNTLDNLLTATAAGWLERAVSEGVLHIPDRRLEAALLRGDALNQVLRGAKVDVAVRIVSALTGYEEARFERWFERLYASPAHIGTVDAEAIGRLVLHRRWHRVLDQMVRRARDGREDLKPALRVCHTMVSGFTRWLLDLSPVSSDEKWLVLEELASDLYPTGPDDAELWDRAGGRHADLRTSGSGRVRWRDAIGQIRRGKGPRAVRLLQEMARDYPLNDQLRLLCTDPDFR